MDLHENCPSPISLPFDDHADYEQNRQEHGTEHDAERERERGRRWEDRKETIDKKLENLTIFFAAFWCKQMKKN